jgi:hypothetical protein
MEDSMATEAVDALSSFAGHGSLEAALSDVAIRFESPQRFREALYFVRCLERDSEAALGLLAARAYLEEAVAPSAVDAELAVDQAALLDGNTFATLWREPERSAWLLDTIELWKQAYAPVYAARHAAYQAEVAAIGRQVDALQAQAAAVERLNTLERLGAPQAQRALTQYREMETLFACPATVDDLIAILKSDALCPYCSFHLGAEAPSADAERISQAIQRGLADQQARLAQSVVSRLLARPGRAGSDRLDRFIAVVQASDLSGLAAILDDGLIAFLEDLLETPAASPGVLDSLARSFPEITATNLDDAVSAFRLLVQHELQRGDGSVHLTSGDGNA